ncbi:hypothetical protein B0A50_05265 [Salinomyces thailandicus]|uniref:Uncharacterized protein n=1 Tax=Salinomyces thailandicus TaxID=706561 RepID=A0A4V5N459_9PEZI|nr:hypothetical protein B0A50_05265 [Salinomyces thailandica]
MEHPPAYTPRALSPLQPLQPRRSAADTRALILGNAAVLRPRRTKDEDIELIVTKRRGIQASAEELVIDQHYAFLVSRKTGELDINIILKGQPRDTVEEALEWMLDRTETVLGQMLVQHGKNINSLAYLEPFHERKVSVQAG